MRQGSRIARSCDVGHRHGLDPALLWLRCRPAGVAPIRPLAWEPPYAVGANQEMAKKQKNKKTKKKRITLNPFTNNLKGARGTHWSGGWLNSLWVLLACSLFDRVLGNMARIWRETPGDVRKDVLSLHQGIYVLEAQVQWKTDGSDISFQNLEVFLFFFPPQ